MNANNSLEKHTPPLYVIALIIIGAILLGISFCWCWARQSRRHRRSRSSPERGRIAQWVANNSIEDREEKISARRARIQEAMHGRDYDDPRRARMTEELRRGSSSPTILHRTPTIRSPVRQSFFVHPPKTAHLRPHRSPT
ncbi:hypothetical protein FA13DRAFT_1796514 [Coprinellus micaceus]|uniref:Uncharacterized protein n=1 Tax=Coprinellus micaceus TaxID=71717 RepID=A0A4Y7SUY5_COPMI|nr:hypothetical protein FA13DRAFT_1796514 [Coprinellus micaceus]